MQKDNTLVKTETEVNLNLNFAQSLTKQTQTQAGVKLNVNIGYLVYFDIYKVVYGILLVLLAKFNLESA